MPSTDKLRRTWFALLRERGVPDEDRHWLQESLTGKPSTREWTRRDWDQAVARLQRDVGLHGDAHAHVREDRARGPAAPGRRVRPPADDVEPGDLATERQAGLIEELADEIEWRRGRELGPWLYLVRRIMGRPEAELRRETLERAWAGGTRGRRLWGLLWRGEASGFIQALGALARSQERRAALHEGAPSE